MDILTLATTALSLASPFLTKIGEGTSRKIGEDIWNLIKKPFGEKGHEIDAKNSAEVKNELVDMLNKNPDFKNELENLVNNAQVELGTINQNIQNNSSIEKQVNIGSNIGNITL